MCVCGLFTAHFWLSLPLPLFWLLFRQGHLWPQTKFARYKLENKWSFKPNHAFHVVLINDNTDARYHSHLKKVPPPFPSPFAIMESALDISTTVKWDIFYLERERGSRFSMSIKIKKSFFCNSPTQLRTVLIVIDNNTWTYTSELLKNRRESKIKTRCVTKIYQSSTAITGNCINYAAEPHIYRMNNIASPCQPTQNS